MGTKARDSIGNHIKRSKSLETKEVRRVSIYASSLVYKNRGKEMKELLKPVFRSILSKREIVLFLICMIYPLITALVSIFQAGIASYAEGEQISFIMFWQIIVHTQWQLTIPTLLLSYSVMSVFRNEISSKRLFLFKDIEKPLIFKAKIYNLMKILGIFIIGTFITSFICYYVFMLPHNYISGHFFPSSPQSLSHHLLIILARVAVYVIVILLVANLSIRYNVAASVLGGVLFMLFSNVAPQLSLGKFLFPTGYAELGGSTLFAVFGLIFISGVYCCTFYYLGMRAFEKIEY